MTEQQATDRLEQIVGSVNRCFRLKDLYERARIAANANQYSLRALPSHSERFIKMARADNYSEEAINHYLTHIV